MKIEVLGCCDRSVTLRQSTYRNTLQVIDFHQHCCATQSVG